ncbi:MAG: DUF3408 domain-containing protein [Prevotellaceae bacterium]|jgi:hypothetical protein|nr:DUF3408 domain-containing protein [Prevotellaceae bacterium]
MAKKINLKDFDDLSTFERMGVTGISSSTPPAQNAAPATSSAPEQNAAPATSNALAQNAAPAVGNAPAQNVAPVQEAQPVLPAQQGAAKQEKPENSAPEHGGNGDDDDNDDGGDSDGGEGGSPAPTKKKKPEPYAAFLAIRNIGSLRRPVTIGAELHSKLDYVVRVALDGKITMSNYLENILLHHFEVHGDELRKMAEKQLKNPLRR